MLGHRELQPAPRRAGAGRDAVHAARLLPQGLPLRDRREPRGRAAAARAVRRRPLAQGRLVEHGFRLPSALDNRPLRFDEFVDRVPQCVFVSATPGPYELEHSAQVVEQVIRPTGLVDPEVTIMPTKGQIDDLRERIARRWRRATGSWSRR